MSTVTTQDGIQIFYKDWGLKSAQPIMSHHGGHSPATIEMRCSSFSMATASLRTTGVATAAGRRSVRATTWTTMPPMPLQWSKHWT